MTDLPLLNRQTAQTPPAYPVKVVQFGGGNFLRAFVDWMIDILNEETDFGGSVAVVKAAPRGFFDAPYAQLAAQDGLFHVQLNGLVNGRLTTQTRLVSAISQVVNPYDACDDFLALARLPDVRFIISNTTEAGIVFDSADRPEDAPPASFPAKLTLFLYERYRHFQGDEGKGCIILPCELIEHNGAQLQQCVLDFVELWGLEDGFVNWLLISSVFCNTLVDRIVPGFPNGRADDIRQAVGFADQMLVEGEQFHSWVIQGPAGIRDEFPTHQTNLHVKFVTDLTPYRDLKVRILNGAHTAMVPVGYLYGLRTVKETVENEVLGRFVADLLFAEILPTLSAPPAEKEQFARDVLERFRNPYLKHELSAIALNSIAKFRARLLPTLLAYAAQFGAPPPRITLSLAALIRFYRGEWQGEATPVRDNADVLAFFAAAWQANKTAAELAAAVLGNESLWGQDLTAVPHLTAHVAAALEQVENDLGAALSG